MWAASRVIPTIVIGAGIAFSGFVSAPEIRRKTQTA